MTETAGGYRCMACGLVFDTKDEADRHEEQHPGMVRKSATTGDTATAGEAAGSDRPLRTAWLFSAGDTCSAGRIDVGFEGAIASGAKATRRVAGGLGRYRSTDGIDAFDLSRYP